MSYPTNVPSRGLYYHYKHDPSGTINNYAYEVIGAGKHSEDDDTFFVVYLPLYENDAYKAGRFYHLRPLEMFMEDVTKDGKTIPRFRKINDEKILRELEEIKNRMYP